jgi:hypothetical protein
MKGLMMPAPGGGYDQRFELFLLGVRLSKENGL